ncbi:MAG: DUF998 domain-containing protein [Ornithinimicrobium sp.]
MSARQRAERGALVLISIAAALFSSNFLLDLVFADTQDWTSVISVLEVSPGHPRILLRVTDVLCGVLVVLLLPYVRAALPASRWRTVALVSTVIYALAGAGAAWFALPCPDRQMCTSPADDLQRFTHDGFSIVSPAALFISVVAVGLATREHGPRWLHRAVWVVFLLGGVAGTLMSGYFTLIHPGGWQTGLAQRFQLAVVSAWIICLGVHAATAGVDARQSPARQ